jgi:hypothetical protein
MAGDTAEQASAAAQKIIQGKYTLVVVAENKAKAVEETFAGLQGAPTPCVVIVPFTTEPEGFATKALGRMLKMATGVNILDSN